MLLLFKENPTFLSMAQQPPAGQGLPIFEASRSHTPHSVGPLWTSDQPVAETWQHTTLKRHKHHADGIRTHHPQQTNALDRAATGTGTQPSYSVYLYFHIFLFLYLYQWQRTQNLTFDTRLSNDVIKKHSLRYVQCKENWTFFSAEDHKINISCKISWTGSQYEEQSAICMVLSKCCTVTDEFWRNRCVRHEVWKWKALKPVLLEYGDRRILTNVEELCQQKPDNISLVTSVHKVSIYPKTWKYFPPNFGVSSIAGRGQKFSSIFKVPKLVQGPN
jgi:hypothetical protein